MFANCELRQLGWSTCQAIQEHSRLPEVMDQPLRPAAYVPQSTCSPGHPHKQSPRTAGLALTGRCLEVTSLTAAPAGTASNPHYCWPWFTGWLHWWPWLLLGWLQLQTCTHSLLACSSTTTCPCIAGLQGDSLRGRELLFVACLVCCVPVIDTSASSEKHMKQS